MEERLQQQIQEYVNGELSGETLRMFEEQLKNDPKLQEEVAFSQDMVATLQNKEALGVHQLFQGIMADIEIEPDFEGLQTYEAPAAAPSSTTTNWLGIVGIAGLAIAISLFVWWEMSFSTQAKTSHPIVQTYLKPHENIINTSGRTAESLKTGMEAYSAGNYAVATLKLSTYLEKNPDSHIQLYLGIAQLLNGEPTLAVTNLEQILQVGDFPEMNVVEWHLALAYIDSGRQEEALLLLENLKKDRQFGQGAKAILKEIQEES